MNNYESDNRSWGTLYCIGTGPGDPELLTIKALRLLQTTTVIFVPRNAASGRTQAFDIIRQFVDETSQQIIPLDFPMVRDQNKLAAAWDKAMTKVAEVLAEGHDAVFPVLGDPLLYGTFNYILKRTTKFSPEAKVVVVPGVTSIQAASAASLLPLAEQEERIAILPAIYEEDLDDFERTLAEYETVVLMKVGSALERFLPVLQRQKRLTNAVYVEHVGQSGEKIVRGEDIALLKGSVLPYFSLLIIRK